MFSSMKQCEEDACQPFLFNVKVTLEGQMLDPAFLSVKYLQHSLKGFLKFVSKVQALCRRHKSAILDQEQKRSTKIFKIR